MAAVSPNSIVTKTIEVPPEYDLGPAMLALSEKQRAFAIAVLQTGGADYTQCAIDAGYAWNPSDKNSIRVTASRLSHDPRIQEAMREHGMKQLVLGAAFAPTIVDQIMRDPTVEPTVRLKAASMLMNRSGMHETSEHKVAVVHKSESYAELMKEVKLLGKETGLDVSKLLGKNIVDADFEEVENTAADFDENSIEDLLG
jgi:hypothetical protein